LVNKFDWWIYYTFKRRWEKRTPSYGGFVYLMYLEMQRWLVMNPPGESVMSSTERFYESQRNERVIQPLGDNMVRERMRDELELQSFLNQPPGS